MISELKSDDIPSEMNILNIVISILMHFCAFFTIKSFISSQIGAFQLSHIKRYVMLQNVT